MLGDVGGKLLKTKLKCCIFAMSRGKLYARYQNSLLDLLNYGKTCFIVI